MYIIKSKIWYKKIPQTPPVPNEEESYEAPDEIPEGNANDIRMNLQNYALHNTTRARLQILNESQNTEASKISLL